MRDLLIITDLDGCLLDAATYAWEPAREALDALRARGIPVVPCTSKTRAETARIQAELGIPGPAIVEGGGAIVGADGAVESLGRPVAELRRVLAGIAAETGGALRGFGDMTDAELAAETGLPEDRAALARRREFDEPFRFLRDETALLPFVRARAAAAGISLSRGGRYWHLHAGSDKGRAVRRLRERFPGARAIGLGDSALDLPLLRAVDLPILVVRPDGTPDPDLVRGLPAARRSDGPGPAGWARAVLEALRT